VSTAFLHTVIDLSLRQAIAPDGEAVLICQVDSNTPILFWSAKPSEGDGIDYSFGKALDTKDTLCLEISPFTLIVKRCAESMCFCVIAPNDVEESIYRIKCIEQGRIVRDTTPDGALGKVSLGQHYEFDLMVCSPTQTYRIETVPTVDIILGKSKIIYQEKG
jgi:hypothetical protein